MLTEEVLLEKSIQIAGDIAAAARPYSQEEIAKKIINSFLQLVQQTPQEMRNLQSRTETAESTASRTKKQNVDLVTRNEQLEAAFRVIHQQIESVGVTQTA